MSNKIKLSDRELFQLALDNNWSLVDVLKTFSNSELVALFSRVDVIAADLGILRGEGELDDVRDDLPPMLERCPPIVTEGYPGVRVFVIEDERDRTRYPVWDVSKWTGEAYERIYLSGPLRQNGNVVERLEVKPSGDDYECSWVSVGPVGFPESEPVPVDG